MFPTSEGMKDYTMWWLVVFFFLLLLYSINGILINNLQSLSAFLSGITMDISPGAQWLQTPEKGSQPTV